MAWPSLAARTKDWGTETLTDADLEGQLDLLVTYINDMMDSTSGHKHDATTAEGPKILISNLTIASRAQGDIYYDNGTNPTRLAAGTSGQFLKTQGAAANPLWATVNQDQSQAGSPIQIVATVSTTMIENLAAIPLDDTLPQITEGTQVLSRAITPSSTNNKLLIQVSVQLGGASAGQLVVALFNTDIHATNAQAVACADMSTAGRIVTASFNVLISAPVASATTFTVRAGAAGADSDFCGSNGATVISAPTSSIIITEIKG